MGVKFQDYYSTLGVARTATADEIRRAYRALARKTHPDIDKTSGAGERFKAITEAYEVLKDPKTRERYDALGANWREGQEFTPPPDFDGMSHRGARPRRRRASGADMPSDGFSSFFESLFGDRFQSSAFDSTPMRGVSIEAEIELTLEELVSGGKRTLRLASDDPAAPARTLEVTLPKGLRAGGTMRLAGQGHSGQEGPGDLLLTIRVAPHPRFTAVGDDLSLKLAIKPHEAVLGARVPLTLLDGGEVTLNVPAGTSSGKTLRLRGLGLERRDASRGDLLVEIAITVPPVLDDEERKLWNEIAERSKRV
ncbi:MAG: DnaJ C-terminal domain-containing protein [Planctomycetota bacterium]|mgnify:CR=1 FL=1|nr:DnaJ C-terminal domain-containing protein [Planctomycetota bacterium]